MFALLLSALPLRPPARARGAGLTGLPLIGLRRAKALGSTRCADKRVLVVGDVMLDEFVWGRVSRISPEAPVPVVQVTGQSFHLGGAGNVAGNVRALGGEAALVGVVGRDAAGGRVREALAASGRDGRGWSTRARPGRTTLKTRIIAHHQQVVRADREDTGDAAAPRSSARSSPPCARRCRRLRRVVVSDYEKGVVTAAADDGAFCPSPAGCACRCSWTPRSRHFALLSRRDGGDAEPAGDGAGDGAAPLGAGAAARRPGAAS